MTQAQPSPTTAVPKEALDLHRRNMKFFGDLGVPLHDFLKRHRPQSQLVWFPDGEVNLRTPQGLFYLTGARAEAEAQAAAAIRAPVRMSFARPAMPTERDRETSREAQAKAETDPWPTTRYDDKAVDFQEIDMLVELADELDRQGIELAQHPTATTPYFVTLFGLGLGLTLKPIIEHYRPRVTLICECDLDLILASTYLIDWRELFELVGTWGGKFELCLESTSQGIDSYLTDLFDSECSLGLDNMISVVHRPCLPAIKVAAGEFQSEKSAHHAGFKGFATDEYNMLKNSFRNLRTGNKRVLNVVQKKTDLPVIVTGSGPSIEGLIDFIRWAKDRAILISSGSSLAILLRNGIMPDIHCNLERAGSILTRHQELAESFDLSSIYAVMPTSIWPGVDSYFRDTIYFFRQVMSPLAVFGDRGEEILLMEGPQVTNTAISIGAHLGARKVLLCGVDLGAANPRVQPRAAQAWQGQRPRHLTIPVRGNFGRTVFTDMALVRQRVNVEAQIRYFDLEVLNLSNGVAIEGARPARAQDVTLDEPGIDKAAHVRELIEQFPHYPRERFVSAWRGAPLRENIATTMGELFTALERADDWNNEVLHRIEQAVRLSGRHIRDQFASRLLRGTVLRMALVINLVFNRLPEGADRAGLFAQVRDILIHAFRKLEAEAYGLVDELEAEDGALYD
ncbi:6-hydroxymethylpterin diphosphokinase MptE-like protein [Rhodospirillum centenum]|uniref:DUF115 domain-containing protein n=1 Tax=Rhodospirillum centenum (strain ATCC 51521 / SW) TaxID=414684 RepID=B6IXT5_RHOCS|nr:6-hydroxymethylpterin diphosphokinase MptE-like protein [Rhodospirillum centenum]ACJ01109.1 conserved hypothetical protein [Rhodospirillum centenum SW]